MFIYKFPRGQTETKLWRRAQGLGFITAVAVGNLATNPNEYRPVIFVVNAEGAIHLFAIRSTVCLEFLIETQFDFVLRNIFQVQRNRVRSAGGTVNSGSRNDSKIQLQTMMSISNDDEQQLQIALSQQLICNPKILLFQGRSIDSNEIH